MSVAFGYNYFVTAEQELIQYNPNSMSSPRIDVIPTTFVCLPIIAITFSAFYGIWVSNDYSAYEYSYTQSKNFKPE